MDIGLTCQQDTTVNWCGLKQTGSAVGQQTSRKMGCGHSCLFATMQLPEICKEGQFIKEETNAANVRMGLDVTWSSMHYVDRNVPFVIIDI